MTLSADYLGTLEPGDYTVTFNYDDGSVDAVFTLLGVVIDPDYPDDPIIIIPEPDDPIIIDNPDDPDNPTDPTDPTNPEGPTNPDDPNSETNPSVPNTGSVPENPDNPNTFDTIYIYAGILIAAATTLAFRRHKNNR